MTQSKKHILSFIPLSVLIICSLVATAIGINIKLTAIKTQTKLLSTQMISDLKLPQPDDCKPHEQTYPSLNWTAENEAEYAKHSDSYNGIQANGEDNFLFLGDLYKTNFSQAIGRTQLTDEQINTFVKHITDTKRELEAQGIGFQAVIAPAKWEVYADKLPSWAQKIRSKTPFDQILNKYPNIPIIDLHNTLIQTRNSTDLSLYARQNSHWTPAGAAVAYRQLQKCLVENDSRFTDSNNINFDSVTTTKTNSEFPSSKTSTFDWAVPQISGITQQGQRKTPGGQNTSVKNTEMPMEDTPFTIENSNATNKHSLLLMRDSMATSLSPMINTAYSQVTHARHWIDYPDKRADIVKLAKEYKSQLVILEITERYILDLANAK